MSRKPKKLESLSQAHGKIQDKFEVTSLDQIWGTGDNSKFGTMDENEFTTKLKGMTRADLENFARKHGSVIVESSERIRAELLKVFRNYVSLLLGRWLGRWLLQKRNIVAENLQKFRTNTV